MGLLSDSSLQKKSGDIIIKYSNFLCIILYVVGIVWFCLLSAKPFNASTYFSENALLPGLVQRDFLSDRETKLYYEDLQASIVNITDEADKKNAILTYVRRKFALFGLAAGDQNFSFQYPLALRNNPVIGSNVYGILRAPRLAGTEAIVINVPYENDKSGGSLPGIALLLGLASTFRRHTYWAKDIIFLVTDFEAIGIQAWTAAYHGNFHDYKQHLSFGELRERSGSIQAAIVLELLTNSISRFNIKFEGYNGQLPNLDLVNTATHLCRHESIPPTVQKRLDPTTDDAVASSVHSFVTLLSMMSNQLTGSATGNHGFFQKYHIEAITLQGVKMKNSKKTFNFGEMGRVIEGIVRSVNNLLERFHQSFFFYLLPATNRYISIGLYMPPFGLLVAGALVKAVALWIVLSRSNTTEEEKQQVSGDSDAAKPDESTGSASEKKVEPVVDSKTPKTEGGEKPKKGDGDDGKADTPSTPQQSQQSVLSIVPQLIVSVLFGLAAYHLPRHSVPMAGVFATNPAVGLTMGALAIQIVACLYPVLAQRQQVKDNVKDETESRHASGKQSEERKFSDSASSSPDYRLHKCVALLAFAVSTFAVSLINISLGLFVAVVWALPLLFVRPTSSFIANGSQHFILLLISPLSLLLVACVVHSLVTAEIISPYAAFRLTWDKFNAALFRSVIEDYVYGNWTYSVCTLVYFPLWLQFWSLMWNSPTKQ